MSNINEKMTEVLAMMSANKVAQKLENVPEEQFAALYEKLNKAYPLNMTDRLNMFKEELGTEQYALLVNSPNFKDMFEKWEQELREKAIAFFKQCIRDLVPNETFEENDLNGLLLACIKTDWLDNK